MNLFLKNSKALPSAKNALGLWWAQRWTGFFLILLTFFLVSRLFSGLGPNGLSAWVSRPLNSLALIFFLLFGFYHAWLGLQLLIEVHVHNTLFKYVSLLLVKGFCFLGAGIGITSLLSLLVKSSAVLA